MRHLAQLACLGLAAACAAPRAEAPASSNHVVVGVTRLTTSFDPRTAVLRPALELSFLLYERLVLVDSSGALRPYLARRWRADSAAGTLTFVLRPGARFHDGSPVRARDVVRSFTPDPSDTAGRAQYAPLLDLLVGGRDFNAGRTRQVEGVSAPDDSTVVLRFAPGHAPDATLLAGAPYVILGPGASAVRENGSGPWRLVAGTAGDSMLVLARVQPVSGYPDTLYYVTIGGQDLAPRLLAGTVDCVPFLPSAVRRALVTRTDVVVRDDGPLNLQLIDFSPRRAAWADVRARRAIAHLVDRPAFLRAMSLRGTLTSGFLSPVGVNRDSIADVPIAADPSAARALLDSAGIAAGDTVRLFVNAGSATDTLSGVVGALGAALRAIDRVPVYVTGGDFTAAIADGQVDIALYLLGMQFTEEPLAAFLAGGQIGDVTHVRQRVGDLSALERMLRADTSSTHRRDVLRRIDARFRSAQPLVPLWFVPGSSASRAGVTGCAMEAAGTTHYLTLRRSSAP
ncbi:MAG: ABC transporter substrate-binding protein [Gemmatimonadaceae bacterium]|jgi:peptide/nickel transport system substrate-binding protein|nr:ABC transporter substrate-binding protein [Gemmatimonadaceae bacterium]